MVINHMEPDHGASIEEILLRYPKVKDYLHGKGNDDDEPVWLPCKKHSGSQRRRYHVFWKTRSDLCGCSMVHWPEAMVTFDTTAGVLFSADAFGSFGSLDGKLFADEVNFDRDWIDDARRYYTNIVGKYDPQVQKLLKKAGGLDIKYICPLHGPVWRKRHRVLPGEVR